MKFLLIALLCGISMATARAADDPITQIKLQHSFGYGGSHLVDELTLNADGSAEFAGQRPIVRNGFMQSRRGFYRGQIAPAKFAELADFLESSSFFDLRAEVGENRSTHPNDTIVSVRRKYLSATVVFHRDYKGQFLAQLEKAFESASAQIDWTRDENASKSGVRGTLKRDRTPDEIKFYADKASTPLPMRFAIVNLTSRADSTISHSTRTNSDGRFQFFAPPGRYWLSTHDFNLSRPFQIGAPKWESESLAIEIEADQFAPARLEMHDLNSNTKQKP